VEVGGALGVGVGDVDPADRLSPQLVRSLPLFPLGVVELKVLVRVAVGPAIHSDRGDIALGIEALGAEHGGELLLDLCLVGGKGCPIQAVAPQAEQVASALLAIVPGRGSMGHPEHHGIAALAAPSVAAQADGGSLRDGSIEATRALILRGAGRVDGRAAAQQYVGHHQGNLHAVREMLLLGFRQLGAQVRNHAVVAGEDAVLAAYRVGLPTFRPAFYVGNLDGAIDVPGAHRRAIQPQAKRRVAPVELAVVEARVDDVLHRVPGCDLGNEVSDQQASNRCVAVGEQREASASGRVAMELAGQLPCQSQTLEPGVANEQSLCDGDAFGAGAEVHLDHRFEQRNGRGGKPRLAGQELVVRGDFDIAHRLQQGEVVQQVAFPFDEGHQPLQLFGGQFERADQRFDVARAKPSARPVSMDDPVLAILLCVQEEPVAGVES